MPHILTPVHCVRGVVLHPDLKLGFLNPARAHNIWPLDQSIKSTAPEQLYKIAVRLFTFDYILRRHHDYKRCTYMHRLTPLKPWASVGTPPTACGFVPEIFVSSPTGIDTHLDGHSHVLAL